MNKINSYNNELVAFESSSQVKEGVHCDVYSFPENPSKDLGIVSIKKGSRSPRQRVLAGERTIQEFKSGSGSLRVTDIDGGTIEYQYPGSTKSVEVAIGEIMEWEAVGDLEYYEICHPPYTDGRFENL